MDLHKQSREKLHELKATAGSFALIDQLFMNPYITIPHAAEILGVTFPTAQRAVEHYLVNAGILQVHVERQRNRTFVAQEILKIFDE